CVRTRCEGASISALATHQEGVARRDERHPPSRADVSHAIRLSVCVMREVSYKKFGETTDKESIRHPADEPAQWMMREIQRISSQPQFVGKLLLLEGYDMGLSRLLISGVDVWLNTPVHPFEASGTSGMKAAMNGTVNLSVLDGW